MFGKPDIPEGECGAFVEDYVPSPIREFWENLLGDDGVETANRRNFADAFLKAAIAMWEESDT